ncbi:MAG TPA: hypothetical protein VH249_07765 [Xanthobacteraceae bacterium]|nr:hypothetical protein [Xanthobacteraceae bacterium]
MEIDPPAIGAGNEIGGDDRKVDIDAAQFRMRPSAPRAARRLISFEPDRIDDAADRLEGTLTAHAVDDKNRRPLALPGACGVYHVHPPQFSFFNLQFDEDVASRRPRH